MSRNIEGKPAHPLCISAQPPAGAGTPLADEPTSQQLVTLSPLALAGPGSVSWRDILFTPIYQSNLDLNLRSERQRCGGSVSYSLLGTLSSLSSIFVS